MSFQALASELSNGDRFAPDLNLFQEDTNLPHLERSSGAGSRSYPKGAPVLAGQACVTPPSQSAAAHGEARGALGSR